jgi:dihydroxyacetone kinase-like protein
MPQSVDLATVFGQVAQELEADREHLNSLKGGSGHTGDNMAANFRLVSEVLSRNSGALSDRDALLAAAQALQEQGRGRTAPVYAGGLREAARKLAPDTQFTLDDLLPLLEGLLGGVQQASGARQGEGTLLDALIPGVLGYMEAKRRGASDTEAILDGLTASRRGAAGTMRRPSGSSAPPQIDPGAAGVGSLLEGLFRGILRATSGLGASEAPAAPSPSSSHRKTSKRA